MSHTITTPDGDIAEDKIVSTTGSYSASAAMNGAGPGVRQMMAFKAHPQGDAGKVRNSSRAHLSARLLDLLHSYLLSTEM